MFSRIKLLIHLLPIFIYLSGCGFSGNESDFGSPATTSSTTGTTDTTDTTDTTTTEFTISTISGNTTEAGGTATFTVKLSIQPTSDVIIAISSNDTGEGTVSPSSLTFTSVNRDENQTVTITGVDDSIVDGNISYTILLAAATSSDSNFHGKDPDDVTVININDDYGGVPDTGQTTSYTSTNGEDNDYTIKAPTYTNNGDNTVTDSISGLIWQQNESSTMNWENALSYCENLSLAGKNDWRLPNIKELASLSDNTLTGVYEHINTTYFPDAVNNTSGSQSSDYWSSTTVKNTTTDAYHVEFGYTFLNGNVAKVNSKNARCVRGGS